MLNPMLYQALEAIFPDGVNIGKEDQPLVIVDRIGPDGRMRRWKEQGGEEYMVCCPMCGDTRYRLSINHAWGTDKTVRYPATKLVKCYNENCQENEIVEEQYLRNPIHYLLQQMRQYFRSAEQGLVQLKLDSVKPRELVEPLPFPNEEWCVPLDRMPDDCDEVLYLRGRRFDIRLLTENWGVRIPFKYPVKRDGKDYNWLAGRLFIPFPSGGWQARVLHEPTNEFEKHTKYFTALGFKKSVCVYGLDRARQFDFGVMVEGVTDTWRLEGPGLGILGKALSDEQSTKIGQHFDLVAIALDPDVVGDRMNSIERTRLKLAGQKVNSFVVPFPDGRDPGDLTFELVWDLIERAAAEAGFDRVRRPTDGQRLRVI